MVIDVDTYERALALAGELSAAPGAGGEQVHEWRLPEVLGWRHSLNDRVAHARAFYGVCRRADGQRRRRRRPQLVNLSVDVQVMNALLLPVVLGFLLVFDGGLSATSTGTHGLRKWVLGVLTGGVTAIGVYAAVGGVA